MQRFLRIPLLLSVILGILFAIAVLLGNLTKSDSPDAAASERSKVVITKPTDDQIAEFVSKAAISLPASAQAIGWREERGMDDMLWLHLVMAKSDLGMFLSNSPFRGNDLQTEHHFPLSPFEEFLSAPPKEYRSGQHRLPNGRVLRILIDESDSTSAHVYLMWFET